MQHCFIFAYCLIPLIIISNNPSTTMSASESHPAAQEAALLKLYVFGSCESDQYYHPRQEMESKRPVCLTDLEEFVLEDEDEEGGETKKTVILNPLRTASISKIACGALHTVVSTVEGQVFTFGCNDEGALGREGPEKVPIEVKLGHIIDLISAGDNHSIFASSGAGKVYFTGNYKFLRGEKMVEPVRVPKVQDINDISGRPNRESRLTKVVSGSNHSVILLDGRVYTRGEPEAHTVGRRIMKRHQIDSSLKFEGIGLENVEDVWCGGYHTLIKTRKGSGWVYCAWGVNKHGQLGISSYEECPMPQEVRKLRNKNIVDVAAGTNFTVVLTEQGELLGCGQNDEGQLGLGEHYQYLDSEEEQERKLEAEIQEKMNLKDAAEQKPEENGGDAVNELKQGQNPVEGKKEEEREEKEGEKEEQEGNKRQGLQEENIYIKSYKPIPIPSKVTHLAGGSEFVYAWNEKQVYSWGFGMNYVLLNGEEENELTPFRVKPKIINEHSIHQLSAGAQHVAYLSYPQDSRPPQAQLSESARRKSVDSRKKLGKASNASKPKNPSKPRNPSKPNKLSKRKRSPAPK